jgi:hypothetical protein
LGEWELVKSDGDTDVGERVTMTFTGDGKLVYVFAKPKQLRNKPMKSVSILLIALTLIALPVAAQTKGNAGDQEAIKSIALKWQDCWNRHN